MAVFLLIAIILLCLNAVQPYILLTANMEDVQALAQQLAASPVVDQVKKIWRRASVQFQKQLKHSSRRAGDEIADEDKDSETNRRTKRIVRDLIALSKEAGYIEPLQQILQKF